jgi:hypothetical protein
MRMGVENNIQWTGMGKSLEFPEGLSEADADMDRC